MRKSATTLAFGLAVLALAGCKDKGASPARAPAPSAPTGASASETQPTPVAVPSAGLEKLTIRVSGNRFIDGTNGLVDLHGANHSGTEFACVQGWGLFSGPGDESVFIGMEKWKLNAVRIPLNENCWLGINGVDAAHGGDAYRKAMINWVSLAHKHGLITILDLHWSAPGSHKSMEQQPMADADHALDFWKSVATTFKADHALIFDLFNEPYLNHFKLSTDPWTCWRDGCTVTGGEGGLTGSWQSAGMQAMLDAVRSTGATQPVMAGGLEWGNDLSGWLAHMPKDRLQQVVAAFHQYQGNMCQDMLCWESTLHPILGKVPIVTGELGESDCGHAFTDKYMDWADSVHASYVMWAWNAWGDPSPTSCGTEKYPMIADWQGTPTPYGASYKTRLAR